MIFPASNEHLPEGWKIKNRVGGVGFELTVNGVVVAVEDVHGYQVLATSNQKLVEDVLSSAVSKESEGLASKTPKQKKTPDVAIETWVAKYGDPTKKEKK